VTGGFQYRINSNSTLFVGELIPANACDGLIYFGSTTNNISANIHFENNTTVNNFIVKDLNSVGIKLPPEITKKLKSQQSVLDRLSEKTILQAMNHKANLGDYLENYAKHLQDGREVKSTMLDMVGFVTDNFAGKEDYSNDGLLFAGFALQHLYNLKTNQNLTFEEILNKLPTARTAGEKSFLRRYKRKTN
jgi:hypothetical protein